jgi:hypothetical protein
VLIQQPAVALTDLGLAAEFGVFALVLGWTATQRHALRGCVLLMFWAFAGAAAVGFVTHGFVREGSRWWPLLWRVLLICMAVAGAATAASAAMLWQNLRLQRWVAQVAGGGLIVLGIVIILNVGHFADGYGIAVVSYAPGMLFLLATFVMLSVRRGARYWPGAIGVVLSCAAVGVQQTSWRVGALDHNALYHVVQAVGTLLLFLVFRRALRAV